MPLDNSKSKKAFSKNVSAEMHAGKPQKQSLAIAYSVKRRAKKMSKGGEPALEQLSNEMPAMAEGGEMKSKRDRAMEAFHKAAQMAKGGEVNQQAEPGSDQWNKKRPASANSAASSESDRSLGQHGAEEEGPQDGGEGFHDESYAGNPGNEHDQYQDPDGMSANDLVAKIMREHMYSKGGMVANEDSGESASDPDEMAKNQPNEFDDLALRDELESDYTGANSGDELGNARESADRADIIKKIMSSRKKKNRMPGSEDSGL